MKTPDSRRERRARARLRLQAVVTLGALPVAHRCELNAALVLDMASRARRGEGLARVVRRGVVAGQTRLIGDPEPEGRAPLGGWFVDDGRQSPLRALGAVTEPALEAKHRMPLRNRAAGVEARVAPHRGGDDPRHGHGGNGDREDDFPSSERVRAL